MCPRCGGLIGEPGVTYGWGGKWCYCPNNLINYPINIPVHQQTNPFVKTCEHCWCKTISPVLGGGDHKVCCNCGLKKKI